MLSPAHLWLFGGTSSPAYAVSVSMTIDNPDYTAWGTCLLKNTYIKKKKQKEEVPFQKMPNSYPCTQDVPAFLALLSLAGVSSQHLPSNTEGDRLEYDAQPLGNYRSSELWASSLT